MPAVCDGTTCLAERIRCGSAGVLRLQLLEQEVERTSITRATLMTQSGMTRQDRHNQGDNLT